MDEKGRLIQAITKAIAYAENGGPPDIQHPSAGKTGEMKSIYQYTPATWKSYAKQYLGKANASLTADNETYVTMKKVGDLIDQGYTAKQIASEWNSGDKDAYTGKFAYGSPSIGVNKKYGVKFNVPAYANTVNNYAKQFYIQGAQEQTQAPQAPQGGGVPEAAQGLMALVKAAPGAQQGTQPPPSPPA